MDTRHITPVILSGGSGTRLWPLSRDAHPKQLLTLLGPASMLQLTARRVADRARFAAPIVVANRDHADLVEAQLAAEGCVPARLILEPIGRNTAAAIALAAIAADADALLLILPSDHVVQDDEAFRRAVEQSMPLADDGWLVTFGIRPDRPETGYGYIKRGEAIGPGLFRAERFAEKPDLTTARAWVADGHHDWNAGMFLFRADAILTALTLHAPDILKAVRTALDGMRVDGVRVFPEQGPFAAVRAQSIDKAVMEKAARIAVAPVEMGWSDIGSWDALYALGDKDALGNHLFGEVAAIDTSNSLIRSDGPLVVSVGIDNLIVIASGNAVIILPRGDSQRVKDVVGLLQTRDCLAVP